MPANDTVDEVVSSRMPRGPSSFPTVSETVDPSTGAVTQNRPGVEQETTREGGKTARVFKDSTLKLMEKLDKPAAHEVGDPDDEAGEAAAVPAEAEDPDDAGLVEPGAEAAGEAGEEVVEGEPAEVETLRADHARLTESNARLVAELDAAKKVPARQRTEREQALVDAEAAYTDQNSVVALRKFIGTVIGAAPDSKEVDEELTGLYADLTARELNVPLSEAQKASRDASRARLALARDKRERVESEKTKAAPTDSGEAQQIEQASRFIDNVLVTKGQNDASLAEEFPKLMTFAEDFDGFKPSELIARAVKHELQIGTMDPTLQPADMIRIVGRKIEQHYNTVVEKITKATQPKTDTTKGASATPAAAKTASQAPRQNPGARTITNATASKAPGTAPKAKPKAAPTAEKKRSDFKTDKEWKNHLLSKHFPT
jgi:hypothetical protein